MDNFPLFTFSLDEIMHSNFISILLLAIFAKVIQTSKISEGPLVVTKQGAIQGSRVNVSGFVVEKFFGIRYGIIPRRFVYSQVYNDSWTGVLDATKYGSVCPQDDPDFPIDEDCLFINIWRPASSSINGTLLPVLLWIPGSGYQHGSGVQNRGDFLAPYGNIIIASINYRLRSFGFAFGDENEIQGNQGVSDVITGLKWVQQNIAFFGGDPSQVTLAGNSAGSMISSIIPVLSEVDDALCSRLWMMSGVTVTPMAIEDSSVGLAKTKLLASKVGCGPVTPGPLTSQTISCLQTVNVSTLLEHDLDYDIKKLGGADYPSFYPVYGTPLIPKPLDQLFKLHPRIKKTSILIAIHQDEAGPFYGRLKPNNKSEAYQMAFDQLSFELKDLTKSQFEPFFEYYFNNTNDNDPKELQNALLSLITDYSLGCTSLMLSELYSTYHSARFAVFRYILGKYGEKARPNGSQHSDAMHLYFGIPFIPGASSWPYGPGAYSEQDKLQSLRLMKLLADYVYGKEPIDWPELHFNRKDPEKKPIVREINVQDKNVEYSKQYICREWSKLFGYDIASIEI